MTERVTIIGDGGWGTAIAAILAGKGVEVSIWGHDPTYLEEMGRTRENRLFLPGVPLHETIRFIPELSEALGRASLAISAVPTKFLRSVFERLDAKPDATLPILSLTKGIEQRTLARPSELLVELLGKREIAVLSGPSHAEEVVLGKPTTVTIAATEESLAARCQELLMTATFRPYTSSDIVGAELGGALKNVIALAAGICTGLGLGDNAMAALLTRGLAEMTRLGVALGAEARTFAGLSGIGDLIVTCTSKHGRNRAVGIAIGEGRTLDEVLSSMSQVAEGVTTAPGARDLGRRVGIELPIVEQVCRVLYEGKDPLVGVSELMSREAKPE